MKNEFESMTEEFDENTLQDQQHEQVETGATGENASSVEELGLEQVEGYDYEEVLGENFTTAGEETTMSSEEEAAEENASQTVEKETVKIKDESSIEDAWFASFDKKDAPKTDSEFSAETVLGQDDRIKITATDHYPWRAICSLLITSKTGKRYVGTGWFIGPGTVMTAGHCVYLHNEGGWAKSIQVMPGRNGNTLPYGSVTSSNLRSVKGWTNSKKQTMDYGAIILPSSKRLGSKTGWFGFANLGSSTLKNKFLNLSGYPADKPSGTQWFHGRKVDHLGTRKIYYKIDTFGGQSGSPVWYIVNGKRYGVGIHAYGSGGGSTNSATRIVKAVFDNMISWKNQGM